jgi:hypothetical protein
MPKSKNVKAWHITVMDGYKTVEYKMFFYVAEANKFYQEMVEKYPKLKVFRENY